MLEKYSFVWKYCRSFLNHRNEKGNCKSAILKALISYSYRTCFCILSESRFVLIFLLKMLIPK